MDLSSLNVDVLLHLMKFVEPVDRFNLVLSGILKGFENVNKGIDLQKRIECFGIELGLRRGGMCELEIRSLMFKCRPDESQLKILERLAGEGYLQNNQQLREIGPDSFHISSYSQVVSSMKTLKKLDIMESWVQLEDLALVFQSCPKLTELRINTCDYMGKVDKMGEDLKNHVRPGFQRLRRLDLECFINCDWWSGLQEMLTWLKECEQLAIFNDYGDIDLTDFVIDDSLTLDPNLARSLGILNLWNFPASLAKWILSVCLNICSMHVKISKQLNGFHKKICRLKKLKKLVVSVDKASELKEIVRSCRQVEILGMFIRHLTLKGLAELEPAESITNITLIWNNKGLSLERVLPVLKRWRHLCLLKVPDFPGISGISVPQFKVLRDFIMGMKHLSYLHIYPDYLDDSQLKILRDQVNQFILPRRPNFKFDISRS